VRGINRGVQVILEMGTYTIFATNYGKSPWLYISYLRLLVNQRSISFLITIFCIQSCFDVDYWWMINLHYLFKYRSKGFVVIYWCKCYQIFISHYLGGSFWWEFMLYVSQICLLWFDACITCFFSLPSFIYVLKTLIWSYSSLSCWCIPCRDFVLIFKYNSLNICCTWA